MMTYFDDDKMTLLLRKQVYPYEYFDSESKFTEQELPPLTPFTVHCRGNVLQKIMHMHRPFCVSLNYKILDNTTIYTSSLMS